ncbi:hypothetical protein, variant [Cryptococcus amylolentus CBS 6039]|uniref:Barwin domain-containing protein n=2 Tax=Cryptococcus amylolentus TaxID=104669 RepID=A0A1E3HCM4_9TREE|nr:hypothetical protein L202_07553 [Cryptococcus amylolentus CBS 6039]XP_018989954.1 hypothetical protein, variant [Cryptococcus amylolentus CBS 6039]ODN74091.1 hypothetical protein L202_07553 [Cryptococcus amylolentus CBS 6039]ODN74092.1 hypothetical protein, variant [Cryptococcus amylolentus CBS 6039]ODO00122.1 hypothetical protein I350_06747 [Cryptococcus amylolentus CBS 6273]
MFTQVLTALFAASAVLSAPVEFGKRSSNETMTGGRATYYTVTGTGSACELTVTDEDFIVALNKPQYNSVDNHYCGEYVTITNTDNGNTETAYVADECPECKWGSLDMSPALFSALADGDFDLGVFPISWVWGSDNSTTYNSTSNATSSA